MTTASLESLRDIHLPPLPLLAAVLPPWWLTATALALLAATLWWLRRWLRRRPLRAALREQALLASAFARDADSTRLASGLSGLLRHYAVARFTQPGVAGLTGTAWLDFLDAHGGVDSFRQGIGAVLAARPYQSDGAFNEAALLALVRRWLQANPP